MSITGKKFRTAGLIILDMTIIAVVLLALSINKGEDVVPNTLFYGMIGIGLISLVVAFVFIGHTIYKLVTNPEEFVDEKEVD